MSEISKVLLMLLFIAAFFGLLTVWKKAPQTDSTIPMCPTQTETTFAMIKPEAVQANQTDKIINMIKEKGFVVKKQKQITITPEQAAQLYKAHDGKPFYNELISYITSGPVVVMELEKENAVADWRKFMGATNPDKSDEGTIRKLFGTSVTKNAVHGSDSVESAQQEITIFFE